MKNSINLTLYNVFFPKDPAFGNPAVVIESVEKESAELQALAWKLNAPVTVFLFHSTVDDKGAPKIRFFYPNRETSICVHGALAAACHLLKNAESIVVVNRDNMDLLLSKDQNRYFINLTPAEIKNKSFDSNVVLAMLALNESDIDLALPFEIATAGSPKLLVPVKSLEILKNLKPQFDKISNWSQKNEINGFYVYTNETLDKTSHFHARNFNPLSGQPEDIATGIAAAALAWRFSKNHNSGTYIIEQGHFLQQPCLIYVNVNNNHIRVGGNVALTK